MRRDRTRVAQLRVALVGPARQARSVQARPAQARLIQVRQVLVRQVLVRQVLVRQVLVRQVLVRQVLVRQVLVRQVLVRQVLVRPVRAGRVRVGRIGRRPGRFRLAPIGWSRSRRTGPTRRWTVAPGGGGLLFGPLHGTRRRRSTRPGAGPAGSSAAPAAADPEAGEANVDALIDALLVRAAEAEARLTPVLDELARVSGGELLGREHRLKPAGSVRRKLAGELADFPDSSAEEVLAGLTDAVRYTVGFVADGYPERAAWVLEALAEAGYEPVGSATRGTSRTRGWSAAGATATRSSR